MKRGSSARILAPLALIAALVALVLVVQGSSSDETATQATTAKTTKNPSDEGKAPTKKAPAKPKKTTVRAGDTLGAISERTGVPVAQIEELNPNLDPQALTVGQTVKLRP